MPWVLPAVVIGGVSVEAAGGFDATVCLTAWYALRELCRVTGVTRVGGTQRERHSVYSVNSLCRTAPLENRYLPKKSTCLVNFVDTQSGTVFA